MRPYSVTVTAVITVSTVGISYAALGPAEIVQHSRAVADEASCRTVDSAIVAYVANEDRPPRSIAELAGYVKGDISAYRIVDGLAAGPGC